ncbi:hypothetical protein Tco_0319601 [Tanacetum coccineum]
MRSSSDLDRASPMDLIRSISFNHSGYFTAPPDRRFSLAIVDWYDLVDSKLFSINEYDSLLEDLRFKDGRIRFSHFRIPGKSLDEGVAPLMSNKDVVSLLKYVPRDREIEVYVDNDVSLVEKRMTEVSLGKGNGILIEEDDVENKNKASTSKVAPLSEGCGKIIYGFSDSDSSDDPPWSSECINEKRQQRCSDEFQFIKLLFEIDREFDLDLSQDPIEKAEQEIWKPCQGDSLNLPDHRYKRWCCSPIPAESDSLPHAHAQTTKTYYKHQVSRIKKAQELKIKTSANSDIKDNSSKTKLRGRLLESFQDDAKYEHVGQDTRSQGSKDDQD